MRAVRCREVVSFWICLDGTADFPESYIGYDSEQESMVTPEFLAWPAVKMESLFAAEVGTAGHWVGQEQASILFNAPVEV